MYRNLKRILVILFLLLITFYAFVEISNRNSRNMTTRQKILKAAYPLWVWYADKRGLNTKRLSDENAVPLVPFYSLKDTLNNGTVFDFEQLRGKKIMLVNTASDCGYTSQYDGLQKLSEQYKDELTIIGFPANDFKEEEKGTDKEIAEFCRINFGISFPLMKKSSVIKGPEQNKVFEWLTDPAKNGWNRKQPSWNFCKYIVSEDGRLTHFFGSTIEPMSKEIISVLNH